MLKSKLVVSVDSSCLGKCNYSEKAGICLSCKTSIKDIQKRESMISTLRREGKKVEIKYINQTD